MLIDPKKWLPKCPEIRRQLIENHAKILDCLDRIKINLRNYPLAKQSLKTLYDSLFTQFSCNAPSRLAARLSTARAIMAYRVSPVAEPIWGSSTIFSSPSRGEFRGRGSVANTSSPAAWMVLLRNASARASSSSTEPRAVCNACLHLRDDLTSAWIREASEGRPRTTYYCDDDFAFVGHRAVVAQAPCPHCAKTSVVVPVDEATAEGIARFASRA